MNDTDNKFLYHYTDTTGLLGMLENVTPENLYITMRATFYRFLNDPNEYQFGVDIVNKYLSTIEDELDIQSKDRLDIVSDMTNLLSIKEIELVELNSNLGLKMYSQYYISFTNKKDSLPFWWMYGNKGSGICIEFDVNKISDAKFLEIVYLSEQSQFEELIKKHVKEGYIHFSKLYESIMHN